MAWWASRVRKEDYLTADSWLGRFADFAAEAIAVARFARPGESAVREVVPDTPPLVPDGSAQAVATTDVPVPVENPAPSAVLPLPGGFGHFLGAGDPDEQLGGGFSIMAAPIGSRFNDGRSSGLLAGGAGQYLVLFNPDLTPGLVIDMAKREIMTGGPQDPLLGTGDSDTLVVSGPLVDGAVVPASLAGIENLVLLPGSSYDLASGDEVAPGATLTVSAMPLGADDTLRFDGSGETDGRLVLLGGPGDDVLIGGAGDDRIAGMDGADTLAGGPGADVFVYENAGQSSGGAYDTLIDFDPDEDEIDLPGAVSGFAAAIEGGALSAVTFDDDLAAALGADGLGAGQAVLFAPDDGDLAGTLLMIVDANGEAGYQAGEDFVFALPNADPADLSNTGIFV